MTMRKRQSIFPAVLLILLGVWFLLDNLGFRLPNLGQLWPAFIIFGGLSALWSYYSGRNSDPEQVFFGLVALGVGAFFFLFTLNVRLPALGPVDWGDMARLWPAFVLIAGVAFMGQFVLTGFKNPGLLVPGTLALGIGLVGFVFTLGFLSNDLGRQLLKFWPLILIVLGLGVLAQATFRKN